MKILGGKRVENGEIFALGQAEKFNLQSRSLGCAPRCNGVARYANTMRLEFAAAFHGFHHGDFVGVFEVGADRDAYADARDAYSKRLQ
jgi:hypothetical protein